MLAGCEGSILASLGPPAAAPGAAVGATAAVARPARPSARPQPAAAVIPADPLSADMAAYLARIQADRLARGLLRTDDGRRDGGISTPRLVRIWTEVALRDEHRGVSLTLPGGEAVLRRWEDPVVYRLEFGPSVPAAIQAADRAQVAPLVQTLARATGHPISLAPAGSTEGNFHVLVLSETERRAIGPRLRALVPGIDTATVNLVENLPREAFCLALAFARGGGAVYTDALAIIRAEHPDLTRIACYHEEMAQGLGLASDSPRARPSLFNDNMEFARLTALDLLLLRLHYDPRLRPGMREAEARPIAEAIAGALAAGDG